MRILITNDDGYTAKGLKSLVESLREFGDLTVVAPKYHQSGMSMAVSMGLKPVAVKKLSESEHERWWYVDGTPSSCVKFALDELYYPEVPDVVVSGINHGANAASAVLYSGTVGAAQEAALAGIPTIAVSLDDLHPQADFSTVIKLLPGICRKLAAHRSRKFGILYNINFPNLPAEQIKGIRLCHQGIIHWEKEFKPYDANLFAKFGLTPADMGVLYMPEVEKGETVLLMAGEVSDDKRNIPPADHHQLAKGYITIVPHSIDTTDYEELARLRRLEVFDKELDAF